MKIENQFLMIPSIIMAEFMKPTTATKVARISHVSYSHVVKVCHLGLEVGLLEVVPTTNKRIVKYQATYKGKELIKNIQGVRQICNELQLNKL
tara:strand:- start:1629 stop:1907 length:279 start_codon:yes stop_codon:yes gene_type:complete